MTLKRFRAVSVFIMAAFAVMSCKDKDDTTVAPSLDGTLKFSVPKYVETNTLLEMTAKGASHPEGQELGVYWKVSPGMEKNDTSKTAFDPEAGATFSYQLDGEIETYAVTCGVFASGYSTKTATQYVTAVKGGMDGTGSISDAGFSASDNAFTDPRDGKKYYTEAIGNKVWFRHNLAYAGQIAGLGNGIPYSDCKAMTDVFGLYYTQDQAMQACPSGWRLPSEADWLDMANAVAGDAAAFRKSETYSGIAGPLMADARFNGDVLWEYWPQVKITNSSRLAALPAGYAVISEGSNKFDGSSKYAAFWTSDKDGERGIYRYIHVESPDLYIGTAYSSFAASVRCIKDL